MCQATRQIGEKTRLLIMAIMTVSLICFVYYPDVLAQEDPEEQSLYDDEEEILITVSFAFNFIDSIPPYLDEISPAKDAKRVPSDTNIIFHVKDGGYGVDLTSIRLWVAGEEIIDLTTSIEGSSNDYKVTYSPPTQFPWNENIIVRVFAHDIASPPNQLDTTYSFKIEAGPAPNLADASVFPNPYKPYKGHTFVTFDGLTVQAKLEVFTIMGERVCTIEETDGDGKVIWNVVNDRGRKLASGIYICRASNDKGEEKFFKLAIIR